MRMRKREPYERLADGTIRFHDNDYESWKSLFQRAGYDIDKITTEEQYREAHSKVGGHAHDGIGGSGSQGGAGCHRYIEALPGRRF